MYFDTKDMIAMPWPLPLGASSIITSAGPAFNIRRIVAEDRKSNLYRVTNGAVMCDELTWDEALGCIASALCGGRITFLRTDAEHEQRERVWRGLLATMQED